ncbi:hypothetical protein LUZ60_010615 [Juncus effusus]|nr:hypothetical protein LUZ60_010615 [Juncus effusus]
MVLLYVNHVKHKFGPTLFGPFTLYPNSALKIPTKKLTKKQNHKKEEKKSTPKIHPLQFLPAMNMLHCPRHGRFFSVRSCLLPFPVEKARFHRQLSVAVDAVQRACSLCVDVKKTLMSNDDRVLEKVDNTPVTIADFSVQALISLELKRHFPDIPLVAEEDSNFLRSEGQNGNILIDSIFNTVCNKMDGSDLMLKSDDVLRAIDRGGKDAVTFNANPATYWVLDPIDGTRGFLKGNDALYVVGLALIVEGEIVLGVMGCPNWKNSKNTLPNPTNYENTPLKTGIIMISHINCGTWTKSISHKVDSVISRDNIRGDSVISRDNIWKRSFVDNCDVVQKARFCIPESQTWDLIPLSNIFGSTVEKCDDDDENNVLILPTCCGSLCKYLMVASGRASVFVQKTRTQTIIKAWDHTVGVICITEAGGKVSDWSGNELDFAADMEGRRIIFPSGGVLTTNGILHEEIINIISEYSSFS